MSVPELRIRRMNEMPMNAEGDFVVYWMIANRRPNWNYSLDRAIELSLELDKPLIVFEPLRHGYRWASDRIHRFVLQGMDDNRRAFAGTKVRYYPYVETKDHSGSGLLETLAGRASAIVTDDFPCFFLPRMVAAAASRLPVAMEAVDSNGLVPIRVTDKAFSRAYDFRRWLQKNLRDFLDQSPSADPLHKTPLRDRVNIGQEILQRWPEATAELLGGEASELRGLPIDHSVGAASIDGGARVGRDVLDQFIDSRLPRYADQRNDPDHDAASGLSPYLHFGHVSVHEVFDRIVERENWAAADLSDSVKGSREGWWGMSKEAESFLDELITWRELGYNMCVHRDDYDQYESLPQWAQETLAQHADDKREHVYDGAALESADTHDSLWNACQRQLVREGRMHNYLRMLWGKKILEWSASPQDALQVMIELNNKFAVDGRNPNSYSGIFWVLGRYDRAWGPERPIFGKIRYMSSENTARKLHLKNYLASFGK